MVITSGPAVVGDGCVSGAVVSTGGATVVGGGGVSGIVVSSIVVSKQTVVISATVVGYRYITCKQV